MHDLVILVTGAGGDIGIAVARCIRDAMPTVRLIGADCRAETAAPAFFDTVAVLPMASDAGYLHALRQLVAQEGVDLLLPLSEAELATLLQANLIGGAIADAKIVSASREVVATGLDKLETFRRLGRAGIGVPPTGVVGSDAPGDYALIVKPRSGQGSKGIQRIDRADFDRVAALRRGDIWQKYIPDEEGEFTCGVTRFPGAETRVIVFRRTLQGGFTGSGKLVRSSAIDAACRAIAKSLDLRGAMNVQLRLDNGRPMVFEINARFSSTVRFRHMLGFEDVVWSIQDCLGESIGRYLPVQGDVRIYRTSEEIILRDHPASDGAIRPSNIRG